MLEVKKTLSKSEIIKPDIQHKSEEKTDIVQKIPQEK